MILEQSIDQWPKNIRIVIAFASNGYPLQKVLKYIEENECICINGTLAMHGVFTRRAVVKNILKQNDIKQPNYFVCHRKRIYCDACLEKLREAQMEPGYCLCEIEQRYPRDSPALSMNCPTCKYEDPGFTETEKEVSFENCTICRPYVEKPVNGDEHNINIYYEDCTVQLFRKIKDKSSEKTSRQTARRCGCFVYEEFLSATDQKDLKVYTIYPNYFLCEVRKAPYVDGIVERDPESGKEVRQQTELSETERAVAKSICCAFKQLICGFDIIRTVDGRSLVIDVNGFSFVKGNQHYYQMCADILRKMIKQENYRCNLATLVFNRNMYIQDDQNQKINKKSISPAYLEKLQTIFNTKKYEACKNGNELLRRGIFSVVRHADVAPLFQFEFTSDNEEITKIFINQDMDKQKEFKIRPQLSVEKANQIVIQISQFLSKCCIQYCQQQIATQFLNLCESQLMEEMIKHQTEQSDEQCQNGATLQQYEGLNLIKYLIINHVAGSKIQIRWIEENLYQYRVNWGGYLTISGLRQAYKCGKDCKEKFFDRAGIIPNIKIFHANDRHSTKTAMCLLLGFFAPLNCEVDELLPILTQEPFNRSDFVCPDIFSYLHSIYGPDIIDKIGFTTQQLQSMLNIDDNVLFISSQKIKNELKQQYTELNKFLQLPQQQSVSNKSYAAFANTFDSILILQKHKLNQNVTHNFLLSNIAQQLGEVIELVRSEMKKMNTPIPMISMQKNQFYESDACITDSFKYTLREFVSGSSEYQFDISKIKPVYELLQYIIVHYRQFAQLPIIISLYNLVCTYYLKFMQQAYGLSQSKQIELGSHIASGLLQTIQDDIDSTFNYFRESEKRKLKKRLKHSVEFSPFTPLQALEKDNKMVAFAQTISQQLERSKETSSTDTEWAPQDFINNKQQVRFYITDAAHIYALYNLLQNIETKESSMFMMSNKNELDAVNYLSQLQFVYYEMIEQNYYEQLATMEETEIDMNQVFITSQALTKKQIENSKTDIIKGIQPPHRFVEIYYSSGSSHEVFQPVPNNCLPVNIPELMLAMFPFISINRLNQTLYQQLQQDRNQYQLFSVIALYRHGDRAPKQKEKIPIKSELLLDFIIQYFKVDISNPQDIYLTNQDKNLQEFGINLSNFLLQYQNVKESQQLLQQIKILKLQIPTYKLQIKFQVKDEKLNCSIYSKYGGDLTELGIAQAGVCAKLFYDGIEQDLNSKSISLSEFSPNITVFTNDECRVKQTADIFTQKLSQLEGDKVKFQSSELELLNSVDPQAKKNMDLEKQLLNRILTINEDLCNASLSNLPQDVQRCIRYIEQPQLEDIQNPLERLETLKDLAKQILSYYQQKYEELEKQGIFDQHYIALSLTVARFQAVIEQFQRENEYDVSKVQEIYDLIRYDALHPTFSAPELISLQKQAYECAKILSRFTIPAEYGTSTLNRMIICSLIAHQLLKKVVECVHNPGVTLFFASVSHITALINLFISNACLNYSDYENLVDFAAHLVLKVYKCQYNDDFKLEVFVSNGSYQNPFKMEFGVPRIQQLKLIGDNFDLHCLDVLLQKVGDFVTSTLHKQDLGFKVLSAEQ